MQKQIYDTVIVGSGPAGLTAAIYNIRADLKTIVLAGNQPGGQLMMTTTVDNWPGYANGTGGVKLMMEMQAQVTNLGGEVRNDVVSQITNIKTENSKQRTFKIKLESGQVLETKAVIVATGAKAKWLGIPMERELVGKGVSGCATCDGMFFRNKVVAVVGGGDTACEDADFLTKFATKVYLIHRRDGLRASIVEQKRVLNNPKIEMVWNSEVVEIVGKSKVESLKVKNNKTGEEMVLPLDGLFVAIGHNPATEFVAELVDRDEEGHVVTGKNQEYGTMTSCEGIFAAGDCTTMNKNYKQAIAAAGDGCKAALDAEKWIKIEQ